MHNKKIILFTTLPILIIFLVVGILVNLLLYKGNIMVFKVTPAVNSINKALSIEKTGGTLELKQEDLNGILDFYLNKSIKNPNVNGIYSTLAKSEMELYIPVTYKNISLLLYTRGKLFFLDKEIHFEPNAFKVGRINLSVKFVLKNLQKYFKNKNVSVNNNTLLINSDLIPFSFTSLSMKDNLLKAGIAKVIVPATIIVPATVISPVATQTSPSVPPSIEVDQNKALLIKANDQLNGVYSSVGTTAEKQIVTSMKSVIEKLINNSNYPYNPEANQTKGSYTKLSQPEKDDFKNAMMDNMDMMTVKKLKATFGF